MADPPRQEPSLEEQFAKAAAQIEEQWKAFWTPQIAESFRRCVEGVYDPTADTSESPDESS